MTFRLKKPDRHLRFALLIAALPLGIGGSIGFGTCSPKQRAMFARGTALLRLPRESCPIRLAIALEPDQRLTAQFSTRTRPAPAYQRSASRITRRVIRGSTAWSCRRPPAELSDPSQCAVDPAPPPNYWALLGRLPKFMWIVATLYSSDHRGYV